MATSTMTDHPTMTGSSEYEGPARFPYLFRNIRDFPCRLFHPPSPSVPKVGTVRSFKLTPCYRVSLQDVLKGRHLPPLGRKEFEDFLYFKEHSAENMYFYFWLEQYEAQWTIWAAQSGAVNATEPATPTTATTAGLLEEHVPDTNPSSKLAMSYARAKETFFTPGSPWELNLPQKTLQQLLHPKKPHLGPRVHPHPSAFASVRFEIETYLSDSLSRFIAQNGGNAGRHRGLFAIFLGVLTIAVGLIPIILTCRGGYRRSWQAKLERLASLPALWLGFSTLICGLHGVCVVIFLFGDARQLYPYELRRPNISSPICCAPISALNANLSANERERERLSDPNRSRYPPRLTPIGTDGGRRTSTVAVTVMPQKDRHTKTEYVDLLAWERNGTVPTSATGEGTSIDAAVDSKYGPDFDDDNEDNGYMAKARTGADQVDFQMCEDVKSGESGSDPGVGVAGSYARKQSNQRTPASAATTTTCSSTAFPGSPVAFDFDALPMPPGMHAQDHKLAKQMSPTSRDLFSVKPSNDAVPATWMDMESASSTSHGPSSSFASSGMRHKMKDIKNWEWNRERKVFSPLTKVFDPVIARTQWEIVIRSCFLALVLSLVVACGSLGLP